MADEKKPVRLITYGDNQYSFDALEKAVLDNYNNYASRFGYGRNKFMKDYQALTEMLRQLRQDQGASFEAGKINFSGNYANERGAFGKNRNQSKHYTHPAWMILDTLQGMTPYEEPKSEKKKVSRAKLQSEFKDLLGVASVDDIPESQRKQILTETLNNLQKRYDFSNPDDWEFEENFGADYFNNMFTNAKTALDTTETPDDDAYYLYTLFGLNKPTQKEESKSSYEGDKARFINGLVQRGISEEVATRYWDSNVEEKIIKPYIEQFFGNAPAQSSTSTPSTTTSSTTTSSAEVPESNTIGVTATSSPQASSNPVKSGGDQNELNESKESGEVSTFTDWERKYMNTKSVTERNKMITYLIRNKDKISGIPTRSTGYVKNKSGIWYDQKQKQFKTAQDKVITLGKNKKDGGYLELLKSYKNG